jgi:hypothetical protein
VPSDGFIYLNPVINFVMDDGAYIYLDGEPVLRVNMPVPAAAPANSNDTYFQATANSTSTEGALRVAQLNLAAGTVTGASGAIVGNVTVLKQVPLLTAGTHTLAVSMHNAAPDSSDLGMSLELTATQTSGEITAVPGGITRQTGPSIADPTDDTVSAAVTVNGVGSVSPSGWIVSGPLGSAAVGATGTYGTAAVINGIPVSELFTDIILTIEDRGYPALITTLPVSLPHVIGTNVSAGADTPIHTVAPDPAGWIFDDVSRQMTMNNGGAGEKVVTTQVINLVPIAGPVQFSVVLDVNDATTGTEI